MANTLNNRVWRIDTVDTGTVDSRHVFVKTVRWVGATTAAHQATIDDPVTGDVLWDSLAAGTNNIEAELMETTWPNGFGVPTLASGILYITTR